MTEYEFPEDVIIDSDGSTVQDQLGGGMLSGGLAQLIGHVSAMASNPTELQRLTTMDAKRKADLESLGIGLGSYAIGKVAPTMPAPLKGLLSGLGVKAVGDLLKR